MPAHFNVLCPVDFSDSSRGAMRSAALIAAESSGQLTLLAVNDPLLTEADALAGTARLAEETARDLAEFFAKAFDPPQAAATPVRYDVATGKPAAEILRVSRETACDLIVMSSHGLTGFRKLFFGSTTERVLRETRVPVLITPGDLDGPRTREDVVKHVKRLLVPVDFTAATRHQLGVASRIADVLQVPILLLHIVEPVRAALSAAHLLPKVEAERRYRADQDLAAAIEQAQGGTRPEALVAYGEPAEEIAKVANDRDVGLVILGLHSSPMLGPRIGSVTYRVLCLAHRAVLALPPIVG
jgi:nucleotide-binding universal stress UspA family protein